MKKLFLFIIFITFFISSQALTPLLSPPTVPPSPPKCAEEDVAVAVTFSFGDKGINAARTKLDKKFNFVIQTAHDLKIKIKPQNYIVTITPADPTSIEDEDEWIYTVDGSLDLTISRTDEAEKLVKALLKNKIQADMTVSGSNSVNCVKS